MRMIPPLGTRGRYSLRAPWTTEPNTLYTCAAIRSFTDLETLGVNILESYYVPMGLEASDVQRDRRDAVAIITLISETTAPIYVPSSYIESYPDLSHRNYHHMVVSASLGPLPDYLDLTFVKGQIASAISETIGVEPEVHLGVAPMIGEVTPEQHEILENAREAAITNRTTDRARLLEAQQRIAQLEQHLSIYEGILRDKGLLPE